MWNTAGTLRALLASQVACVAERRLERRSQKFEVEQTAHASLSPDQLDAHSAAWVSLLRRALRSIKPTCDREGAKNRRVAWQLAVQAENPEIAAPWHRAAQGSWDWCCWRLRAPLRWLPALSAQAGLHPERSCPHAAVSALLGSSYVAKAETEHPHGS
mmetsp:Transcript_1210/g.1943  ORF Transcript_1210/g.1943 Transcript_1210/m.1943 type:complete len:158 (-) Transcript_1210:270-743(-)